MKQPTLSIITINYNALKDTMDFLESIFFSKAHMEYPFEVIVVDNASKEDPQTSINECYPEVIVIRSEKNLGFAGGNNLGILASKGDYLFIVNNDTFPDLGRLSTLIDEYGKNMEYGVLCPLLLNMDQTIQFSGYSKINLFTGRNKTYTSSSSVGIKDSYYPHGAAMLISRENLEKVGLMPEHYFLYYEELDWGEQIRNAGLKIGVSASATLVHNESSTTGKISDLKLYFLTRNRILYIRRNFGVIQKLIFLIFFLFVSVPKHVLVFLTRREFKEIKTFMEAIKWHLTNSTSSETLGYKFNSLKS
jgi:hypothetical protein